MKSLITLLALTSLSLAEKPKLALDIEPGWIPTAASAEYRSPKELEYSATKNAFAITVKPSIDWKFLYGWFELTSFSAAPKEGASFVPFRMSYSNEVGLYHNFSWIKISAGWLHNCQHKVIVATYYDSAKRWNDVGYDLIFLRFHWSNFP